MSARHGELSERRLVDPLLGVEKCGLNVRVSSVEAVGRVQDAPVGEVQRITCDQAIVVFPPRFLVAVGLGPEDRQRVLVRRERRVYDDE